MAQGDPQGWESLGANDPLLYKANLRLNRETGSGQIKENIRVVTNRDNGNYDVYRTAFGAGDKKLFGYNASDDDIVVDPNNKAIYDQFFTGPRSQQLTDLNKSVKQATLKLAENNVSGGSGSASQAALDRLKNGPGYKPTAAAPKITPPGANPNGADPTGGAPGGESRIADVEKESETESAGTRNVFPQNLIYPTTLAEDKQDVIKFNMVKYRPRTLKTGGDLNPVENRSAGTIIGTVVLPIPNGISDSNGVTWGGDDFNPLKALGVDIASTGITQGPAAAMSTVGKGLGAAQGNIKTVQQLAASAFTEAATGTSNLLSRTTGQILNPNLELLFSAPTLRSFQFTFKLASRSEPESRMIRSIIRFFKQGSAPIKSGANLFLKAPHTFQIQYLHKNKEHKFLNKFKECALQAFGVSYTPEGQYATFNDGAMVSYQITMQFQELEPIFNDDYTNDGTNPSPEIGF
jgi:hypothetical protein